MRQGTQLRPRLRQDLNFLIDCFISNSLTVYKCAHALNAQFMFQAAAQFAGRTRRCTALSACSVLLFRLGSHFSRWTSSTVGFVSC